MPADRLNGIPRVELQLSPRARRVVSRVVVVKPVSAFHRRVVAPIDAMLLRRTQGRLHAAYGLAPVVMLRTTGARSGAVRDVALGYFTDGDDVILIASNYGQAQCPSWYYNLLKTPECELFAKSGSGCFVAHTTAGSDRDRLFSLAEGAYGIFWHYRASTDGVRTIPVLRLAPK